MGHPNLRHGDGKSQEGASERGHEGRLAPKKSAYFPRTGTIRTLRSLLGLVGLADIWRHFPLGKRFLRLYLPICEMDLATYINAGSLLV